MPPKPGTPVSSQRIWQEHVSKELRFQVPRTEFVPNPTNVVLLPDKPSDRRRELALRSDAVADAERQRRMDVLKEQDPKAHADVMGMMQRADSSPHQKYAYPLTTSQEIGWDLEFARRHAAESSAFISPHTNSDVAAFADAYVANHGYNPYSTQQFKYHPRK